MSAPRSAGHETTASHERATAADGLPDHEARAQKRPEEPPREFGGAAGPEPTRFGDWEKRGRCIDF